MKVKITLLEEVLGSSPSNEELLATYIASKAPTGDLTAEEVDNIKAQNSEDRITVFPKTADGTPFLQVQQQSLKSNVSTLSLRIWFVNASTTAQSADLGSGETAARAALNGRKSKNDDQNKNAAPVHHHRNGKKTEHRKKL